MDKMHSGEIKEPASESPAALVANLKAAKVKAEKHFIENLEAEDDVHDCTWIFEKIGLKKLKLADHVDPSTGRREEDYVDPSIGRDCVF